jgi:hypothetical protein
LAPADRLGRGGHGGSRCEHARNKRIDAVDVLDRDAVDVRVIGRAIGQQRDAQGLEVDPSNQSVVKVDDIQLGLIGAVDFGPPDVLGEVGILVTAPPRLLSLDLCVNAPRRRAARRPAGAWPRTVFSI